MSRHFSDSSGFDDAGLGQRHLAGETAMGLFDNPARKTLQENLAHPQIGDGRALLKELADLAHDEVERLLRYTVNRSLSNAGGFEDEMSANVRKATENALSLFRERLDSYVGYAVRCAEEAKASAKDFKSLKFQQKDMDFKAGADITQADEDDEEGPRRLDPSRPLNLSPEVMDEQFRQNVNHCKDLTGRIKKAEEREASFESHLRSIRRQYFIEMQQLRARCHALQMLLPDGTDLGEMPDVTFVREQDFLDVETIQIMKVKEEEVKQRFQVEEQTLLRQIARLKLDMVTHDKERHHNDKEILELRGQVLKAQKRAAVAEKDADHLLSELVAEQEKVTSLSGQVHHQKREKLNTTGYGTKEQERKKKEEAEAAQRQAAWAIEERRFTQNLKEDSEGGSTARSRRETGARFASEDEATEYVKKLEMILQSRVGDSKLKLFAIRDMAQTFQQKLVSEYTIQAGDVTHSMLEHIEQRIKALEESHKKSEEIIKAPDHEMSEFERKLDNEKVKRVNKEIEISSLQVSLKEANRLLQAEQKRVAVLKKSVDNGLDNVMAMKEKEIEELHEQLANVRKESLRSKEKAESIEIELSAEKAFGKQKEEEVTQAMLAKESVEKDLKDEQTVTAKLETHVTELKAKIHELQAAAAKAEDEGATAATTATTATHAAVEDRESSPIPDLAAVAPQEALDELEMRRAQVAQLEDENETLRAQVAHLEEDAHFKDSGRTSVLVKTRKRASRPQHSGSKALDTEEEALDVQGGSTAHPSRARRSLRAADVEQTAKAKSTTNGDEAGFDSDGSEALSTTPSEVSEGSSKESQPDAEVKTKKKRGKMRQSVSIEPAVLEDEQFAPAEVPEISPASNWPVKRASTQGSIFKPRLTDAVKMVGQRRKSVDDLKKVSSAVEEERNRWRSLLPPSRSARDLFKRHLPYHSGENGAEPPAAKTLDDVLSSYEDAADFQRCAALLQTTGHHLLVSRDDTYMQQPEVEKGGGDSSSQEAVEDQSLKMLKTVAALKAWEKEALEGRSVESLCADAGRIEAAELRRRCEEAEVRAEVAWELQRLYLARCERAAGGTLAGLIDKALLQNDPKEVLRSVEDLLAGIGVDEEEAVLSMSDPELNKLRRVRKKALRGAKNRSKQLKRRVMQEAEALIQPQAWLGKKELTRHLESLGSQTAGDVREQEDSPEDASELQELADRLQELRQAELLRKELSKCHGQVPRKLEEKDEAALQKAAEKALRSLEASQAMEEGETTAGEEGVEEDEEASEVEAEESPGLHEEEVHAEEEPTSDQQREVTEGEPAPQESNAQPRSPDLMQFLDHQVKDLEIRSRSTTPGKAAPKVKVETKAASVSAKPDTGEVEVQWDADEADGYDYSKARPAQIIRDDLADDEFEDEIMEDEEPTPDEELKQKEALVWLADALRLASKSNERMCREIALRAAQDRDVRVGLRYFAKSALDGADSAGAEDVDPASPAAEVAVEENRKAREDFETQTAALKDESREEETELEAPSPHDRTPSPGEVQQASSPHARTPSPGGLLQAPSPHDRTPSPGGVQQAPSPHDRTPSPGDVQQAPSPHDRTPSPRDVQQAETEAPAEAVAIPGVAGRMSGGFRALVRKVAPASSATLPAGGGGALQNLVAEARQQHLDARKQRMLTRLGGNKTGGHGHTPSPPPRPEMCDQGQQVDLDKWRRVGERLHRVVQAAQLKEVVRKEVEQRMKTDALEEEMRMQAKSNFPTMDVKKKEQAVQTEALAVQRDEGTRRTSMKMNAALRKVKDRMTLFKVSQEQNDPEHDQQELEKQLTLAATSSNVHMRGGKVDIDPELERKKAEKEAQLKAASKVKRSSLPPLSIPAPAAAARAQQKDGASLELDDVKDFSSSEPLSPATPTSPVSPTSPFASPAVKQKQEEQSEPDMRDDTAADPSQLEPDNIIRNDQGPDLDRQESEENSSLGSEESELFGQEDEGTAEMPNVQDLLQEIVPTEVIDAGAQTELSAEASVGRLFEWLRLNLMQRQQAVIYNSSWITSVIEDFPTISLENREQMLKDFEEFLKNVMGLENPIRGIDQRRRLRQRIRENYLKEVGEELEKSANEGNTPVTQSWAMHLKALQQEEDLPLIIQSRPTTSGDEVPAPAAARRRNQPQQGLCRGLALTMNSSTTTAAQEDSTEDVEFLFQSTSLSTPAAGPSLEFSRENIDSAPEPATASDLMSEPTQWEQADVLKQLLGFDCAEIKLKDVQQDIYCLQYTADLPNRFSRRSLYWSTLEGRNYRLPSQSQQGKVSSQTTHRPGTSPEWPSRPVGPPRVLVHTGSTPSPASQEVQLHVPLPAPDDSMRGQQHPSSIGRKRTARQRPEQAPGVEPPPTPAQKAAILAQRLEALKPYHGYYSVPPEVQAHLVRLDSLSLEAEEHFRDMLGDGDKHQAVRVLENLEPIVERIAVATGQSLSKDAMSLRQMSERIGQGAGAERVAGIRRSLEFLSRAASWRQVAQQEALRSAFHHLREQTGMRPASSVPLETPTPDAENVSAKTEGHSGIAGRRNSEGSVQPLAQRHHLARGTPSPAGPMRGLTPPAQGEFIGAVAWSYDKSRPATSPGIPVAQQSLKQGRPVLPAVSQAPNSEVRLPLSARTGQEESSPNTGVQSAREYRELTAAEAAELLPKVAAPPKSIGRLKRSGLGVRRGPLP
eukprot:TRINITY_DN4764_c0_g1_i1.p1 TRINITY_DN4764_c0_g1~~TRINITY_DN4764_c0_g1_i1.p1  ORF type:complete len:2667 (-),score=676.03 TRINITY_DN4764_c0_g1_i1:72-8072(-)